MIPVPRVGGDGFPRRSFLSQPEWLCAAGVFAIRCVGRGGAS